MVWRSNVSTLFHYRLRNNAAGKTRSVSVKGQDFLKFNSVHSSKHSCHLSCESTFSHDSCDNLHNIGRKCPLVSKQKIRRHFDNVVNHAGDVAAPMNMRLESAFVRFGPL